MGKQSKRESGKAQPRARQDSDARKPSTEERTDLPPLVERVSFLAHRVNARIAQACAPMYRELDVDLYSSRILALMHEHKQMSVGEMVDFMVLPQSTISHQLQRLERRGLLRRRRSPDDNRSVMLTLTPQGRKVARQCYDLAAAVYDAITAEISGAEMNQLTALLKQMFDSLKTPLYLKL